MRLVPNYCRNNFRSTSFPHNQSKTHGTIRGRNQSSSNPNSYNQCTHGKRLAGGRTGHAPNGSHGTIHSSPCSCRGMSHNTNHNS